jgi:hypothetical protein
VGFCHKSIVGSNSRPNRHDAVGRADQYFIAAVDGVSIGPRVDSCGASAYGKETIVSDINTDPRNADLAAEKDRTYVWVDVAEVAVGDQQ